MKPRLSHESLSARNLLGVLSGVVLLVLLVFAGVDRQVSATTGKAVSTSMGGPWVYMGTDVRMICEPAYRLEYEWGVTYNNDSPIIRVVCNQWNYGSRITTYPPYPTGDAQPFTWGGVCWIYNTASSLDDACSIAYHGYYYEDAMGKLYMAAGNGCDALPSVYRRRL